MIDNNHFALNFVRLFLLSIVLQLIVVKKGKPVEKKSIYKSMLFGISMNDEIELQSSKTDMVFRWNGSKLVTRVISYKKIDKKRYFVIILNGKSYGSEVFTVRID